MMFEMRIVDLVTRELGAEFTIPYLVQHTLSQKRVSYILKLRR